MPIRLQNVLGRYISSHRTVDYRKSQLVTTAGMATGTMYYLRSGYVRQYVVDISGSELTLFIYGQGDLFFLPWIFGKDGTVYSFETVSRASLVPIPMTTVRQMIQNDSSLYRELSECCAEGMNVSLRHIESLTYKNAIERVAAILLQLFDQHTTSLASQAATLDIPLTHRLIASYSGISRETATLAINALKARGLITISGQRVAFVDIQRIKQIARATSLL